MGSLRDIQLAKMTASNSSSLSSRFGQLTLPFRADRSSPSGTDLDKTAVGESTFLMSIDTWGDPKKRVGR